MAAQAELQLQEIAQEHEAEFLKMMSDFAKNDPKIFAEIFARPNEWSPVEFKKYLKDCARDKMDWRPGAKGVSLTHYVLVGESGRICGYGRMRFPLTDETEHEGGNLCFDVPPSLRGQDFEAYTLNGMLFEAVRAGLACALVTCDAEDRVAIRAIEMNRGELENVVESTRPKTRPKMLPEIQTDIQTRKIRRYWIRFRP